ncbi:hypothetical protein VTN77DRAFT_74 [Rasamsonia byssochlamydoides]|uniref:uncharacterized protein n=1 Tax=Rasamsonia byssochlamydoides TaxID=89139 RepID=UPI003742A675
MTMAPSCCQTENVFRPSRREHPRSRKNPTHTQTPSSDDIKKDRSAIIIRFDTARNDDALSIKNDWKRQYRGSRTKEIDRYTRVRTRLGPNPRGNCQYMQQLARKKLWRSVVAHAGWGRTGGLRGEYTRWLQGRRVGRVEDRARLLTYSRGTNGRGV